MYISKFRVKNYKSYYDSGEINLGPGINIITGQNNAGKTALLQALSLSVQDVRHQSTKTRPTKLSQNTEQISLSTSIIITRDDFETYVFDYMSEFYMPIVWQSANDYTDSGVNHNLIKDFNTISFEQDSSNIQNAWLEGENYKFSINDNRTWRFEIDKSHRRFINRGERNGVKNSFNFMAQLLKQRIYFFHAERLSIGSSKFGNNKVLAPNASNLPQVLNILQSDKIRFAKYISLVKIIFPQIFDISVVPDPSSHEQVQIVIWNEDPILGRNDLVVPLSESGTGLGQVLAILYVVLTTDISTVIIIDEPNSFLHPGASRKLIEILKHYPQHQFIISTHSPSTIAAANPKTINVVRTKDAQSYIEEIDVTETNKQQLYLAEIGAKLSDVFGADNILWVEGKTEEICFPRIIEATDGISLMGTSILGVQNTGDLVGGKKSELVFQIYEKISKAKGLMPPTIGFIFDLEDHTEKNIQDLKRRGNNLVSFIPRTMYENYLLNPKGIFEVINNIEDIEVTLEQVEEWIKANKWNKSFINDKEFKEKTDDVWMKKVHAGKFLKALFSELTEKKVEFDKITHSVALTEWIIENSLDDLKEIQDLLKGILK